MEETALGDPNHLFLFSIIRCPSYPLNFDGQYQWDWSLVDDLKIPQIMCNPTYSFINSWILILLQITVHKICVYNKHKFALLLFNTWLSKFYMELQVFKINNIKPLSHLSGIRKYFVEKENPCFNKRINLP